MTFTRRQFGVLAAGSGAASVLKSFDTKLNLGIGTFSYHNLTMAEMVIQLKELGVKEIEMSHGTFMLMKPPTPEMVQSARMTFDKEGVRCVSYYTATIKNRQDIDYAVRYAKMLGAGNVSGDATGPILKDIDKRFTTEGLTFGIHNHWFQQGFPYQSTDDILRALSGLSGTMGATLDVGQMAACGNDPVDAVRRLAPHLKLVHLKDVQAAGAEHNVLLGHGIVDIPAVMAELKRFGFKRLVALEYEKEGNVDSDMREEWQYAQKLA